MKQFIIFLDSIYFSWDSNEVLIFNREGIPIKSYVNRNKIGEASKLLIKYKIISNGFI